MARINGTNLLRCDYCKIDVVLDNRESLYQIFPFDLVLVLSLSAAYAMIIVSLI